MAQVERGFLGLWDKRPVPENVINARIATGRDILEKYQYLHDDDNSRRDLANGVFRQLELLRNGQPQWYVSRILCFRRSPHV